MSRKDLCERFDKWHSLFEEALAEDNSGISKARTSTLEARARAACQKVQLGEVSPRQFLVGASVAPSTEESFRNGRRRSSLGPGGWTYEHLKVLMDEMDVFDFIFEAASSVAQERVPVDIQGPLMSARLTALSKNDGGVRGIATGCTFRRLVARSLARQFAEDFEKECAPFQYARTVHASRDR